MTEKREYMGICHGGLGFSFEDTDGNGGGCGVTPAPVTADSVRENADGITLRKVTFAEDRLCVSEETLVQGAEADALRAKFRRHVEQELNQ